LKKGNKLSIPKFTEWTTTSVARELAPQDADWVYIRTAALARKIYLKPHTGVSTLKHIFGSNKDRGNLRNKHQAGFGKILRWALKSLEDLKVLKRDKNSATKKFSRVITVEGQTELNRIAT
jgi:small subunit ribosomal protein S19e